MFQRFIGARRAGKMLVVLVTIAGGLSAGALPAHAAGGSGTVTKTKNVKQACAGTTRKGEMRCFALTRTDVTGRKGIIPHVTPSGYGPADLQDAYDLPSTTTGAGQTVAIVDAFDDPTAEADLGVYRSQFGLAPCTTANGCFHKVNQDGLDAPLPTPDVGWAEEISLDIQMVSAICPNCHILLVEANSNFDVDLFAAVDTAVAMGAKYVSNSYGGGEDPSELTFDASFNHPGVAITASTGDFGFGVSYPAASQYVTAVGGTSLVTDSNARGWSETAWSGAGSGCSDFEPKPSFQTDPDCSNRTDADVSAVADPATGVAVYDTFGLPGWAVFGGTSVSAPIIASTYALAGTPESGTYPNSYPYSSTFALNDVTSGSNGSCGGSYLCNATTGYDGPTGLGTPEGVLAFGPPGPHGHVAGQVTNSGTGLPISGAQVTAGTGSGLTDGSGHYDLSLAVGTYDVTAAAFGFAPKTVTGVAITENNTTTQNIALDPVPSVTLSGTVTDGSGHGWPLYAKITVDGVPGGPIYTAPGTGHYAVSLPASNTYMLHVSAVYPGYQSADVSVSVGATDTVRNISLQVDSLACDAPGYAVHVAGVTESFDAPTVPAGWSVINHTTGGGWGFTDDGNRGNLTGGDGGFAMIDSDHLGPGLSQDTELRTPMINFTGVSSPTIGFNSDYFAFLDSTADVDLSIDGGATFNTVLHQTSSVRGPILITIPIPQAANQSAVQVSFRFRGDFAFWWEVDNAFVGNRTCDPIHGGLVVGNVNDGNTGAGVNGATVTSVDAPTETATSAATPDDPNLGDGFYWMFSSLTGSHKFTASRGGYKSQTQTINVATDSATTKNFTLGAGHFVVTPDTVHKTVKLGNHVTAPITIKNTGSVTATLNLAEQDNGFTLLTAQTAGAPLNLVNGTYSSHRLATSGRGPTVKPAATPYAAPWTDIADYPISVMDNFVGFDSGKLYSVGGTDGIFTLNNGYSYDPGSGVWTPIAGMANDREKPTGAFINGKFYVTGGWGDSGDPVNVLEIYDPAANSWSTGASVPTAFAASASAVVNGKLYVIGGCDTFSCGFNNVYVYDPAADSWSAAANYPLASSWLGCGTLGGQIYCAGGTNDSGDTAQGYSYNPATDSWSPIANIPIDLWGMGYTAGNGVLLLSGGVTNGNSTLTNQGFMFDPGAGTWTAIANSNNTVYRGGSTCGFYKIGGSTGGFSPIANSEVLPGFDQCSGASDVTWLSESKTSVKLKPGGSIHVTLTLNAGADIVTQPGDYGALLTYTSDTPYQVPSTNVVMSVTPPASWGKVMGTVTGVACDGSSTLLAGATVQINTHLTHFTLKTDKNGVYALWLDKANNPLTMIAAKDGWQPQTRKISITAGATKVVNWALLTTNVCH
jgi:hypothetical protein